MTKKLNFFKYLICILCFISFPLNSYGTKTGSCKKEFSSFEEARSFLQTLGIRNVQINGLSLEHPEQLKEWIGNALRFYEEKKPYIEKIEIDGKPLSSEKIFSEWKMAMEISKASILYLQQTRINNKPLENHKQVQELIDNVNSIEDAKARSYKITFLNKPVNIEKDFQEWKEGVVNAVNNLAALRAYANKIKIDGLTLESYFSF